MKNRAVVILKFMTSLVIILIGVVIWLFLNQPKKAKEILPTEPEVKNEVLDINSELVKKLPYPNMQEKCNTVEMMGRYNEKVFKVEDIELAEKMDTAYKKMTDNQEKSISAEDMQKYTEMYWGKVDDYKNFTFSINNTNYSYDEEENVYYIEREEEENCEVTIYAKRFMPVLLNAERIENQIVLDYVIVYYIEDSSNKEKIVYHIYQDKGFTNHLETVEEKESSLKDIASKNKSKLEHYTFIFKEENNNFYFAEGKKNQEFESLEELTSLPENLNLLSLEEFCFDFNEQSVYQKNHFSIENIDERTRLLLAFYDSYKKELFDKEEVRFEDRIEYVFNKDEVKTIYQNFWGEDLNFELENFKQFNYEGILEDNQYRFIINTEETVCATTRKYVELKQEKIYQKEDIIYIDYKIRFIDREKNNLSIYQERTYNSSIKENIRKKDIYEEYWDLEYITYRYVFKKQKDGKYYFLEGLYI
ncbi:MAG: hypothetical protein HFH08_00950 [Bacilli bacterium]|nr:hypothetical protein [Bacilli bacterium]